MDLEHTTEVKKHVFDFMVKYLHEEYEQPFAADPEEMQQDWTFVLVVSTM